MGVADGAAETGRNQAGRMMNFQEHHELYCSLTGLHLRYMPLEHDSDWYLWAKTYDQEDLKQVVPWLRQRYKDRPDILANTLMFRHLIRCRDYFGEYLAQAQADARKPKATERDRVLSATGRPMTHRDKPAQSAGQVLEHTRMAEKLAAWKQDFFKNTPPG